MRRPVISMRGLDAISSLYYASFMCRSGGPRGFASDKEVHRDMDREMPSSTPRLGIALGGGSELGVAHLGVIEVLEQAGLNPLFVAGSSAGALVGAFYAAGASADTMMRIALRLNWRRIQRLTFPVLALSTNEPLRRFLNMTLPVKEFSRLARPLRLVTTDLQTAEMVVFEGGPSMSPQGLINDPEIVFTSGPLVEAVRASCTRPVINRPVRIGERLLVDGGLANNVPSMLCRDMGADVVIGVDLVVRRRKAPPPTNILAYAVQTHAINLHWALKSRSVAADILIQPDFSNIETLDFSAGEALADAGRHAAEEALPSIRAALGNAAHREA